MNALGVREMTLEDVEPLVNYWFESTDEHLIGMGVDIKKLPSRKDLFQNIRHQIKLPYTEKKSYALIWTQKGRSVGHSNVNPVDFGNSGKMHLHLWQSNNRQKGIGTTLVRKSLRFFFNKLELKVLYCEPYALNPAPNKTLEKVGFEFVKKYITIPGAINFEQEVNRWRMTKEQFLLLPE